MRCRVGWLRGRDGWVSGAAAGGHPAHGRAEGTQVRDPDGLSGGLHGRTAGVAVRTATARDHPSTWMGGSHMTDHKPITEDELKEMELRLQSLPVSISTAWLIRTSEALLAEVWR